MKSKTIKGHHIRSVLILLITAAVCYFSGLDFLKMHVEEAVYPSPHLKNEKRLSDYFSGLKNSPGDSSVYVFEGQNKGGNLLILGGTHPNEPAGFITAVLLVENLAVKQGKVIVIPRTNSSGFMHSDPQEGNHQNSPRLDGGRALWSTTLTARACSDPDHRLGWGESRGAQRNLLLSVENIRNCWHRPCRGKTHPVLWKGWSIRCPDICQ